MTDKTGLVHRQQGAMGALGLGLHLKRSSRSFLRVAILSTEAAPEVFLEGLTV